MNPKALKASFSFSEATLSNNKAYFLAAPSPHFRDTKLALQLHGIQINTHKKPVFQLLQASFSATRSSTNDLKL